MLNIVFLSLILYSSLVFACPRCWDKYQDEEIVDFSKGNHPKKEKSEVKIESDYEKKLATDCHIGIAAACDQRVRISRLKAKKQIDTP
ncbi:MAG: hypothetical protein ACOYOK_11090 [Pseudobdellovibrionaceae bacterium]|jgi:hypothetical protein